MLTVLSPIGLQAQESALPPEPQVVVPVRIPEPLTIRIISGDNASNFLKRRFAVSPVVEITDRNHQPIAGATVTFNAPDIGPTVRFGAGKQFSSAVTELDGRATASSEFPIKLGKFQMMVTARYSDYQIATAVIHQSNYKTRAKAKKSGVSVRMQSTASSSDK